MKNTKRATGKFAIALAFMALGMLLNQSGLGATGFSVFGSVGNYFIWAGMGMIVVATLAMVVKRDRAVDERMHFVATKAMRMTFVVFVAVAFAVMVIDGINPITMPYHLFMSYLVSGIVAVYYIAYRILLRRY